MLLFFFRNHDDGAMQPPAGGGAFVASPKPKIRDNRTEDEELMLLLSVALQFLTK